MSAMTETAIYLNELISELSKLKEKSYSGKILSKDEVKKSNEIIQNLALEYVKIKDNPPCRETEKIKNAVAQFEISLVHEVNNTAYFPLLTTGSFRSYEKDPENDSKGKLISFIGEALVKTFDSFNSEGFFIPYFASNLNGIILDYFKKEKSFYGCEDSEKEKDELKSKNKAAKPTSIKAKKSNGKSNEKYEEISLDELIETGIIIPGNNPPIGDNVEIVDFLIQWTELIGVSKKSDMHRKVKVCFDWFYTFDGVVLSNQASYVQTVLLIGDEMFVIMEENLLAYLLGNKFDNMTEVVKSSVPALNNPEKMKKINARIKSISECFKGVYKGVTRQTVSKKNNFYLKLLETVMFNRELSDEFRDAIWGKKHRV